MLMFINLFLVQFIRHEFSIFSWLKDMTYEVEINGNFVTISVRSQSDFLIIIVAVVNLN